jgi:hypothetical protein
MAQDDQPFGSIPLGGGISGGAGGPGDDVSGQVIALKSISLQCNCRKYFV